MTSSLVLRDGFAASLCGAINERLGKIVLSRRVLNAMTKRLALAKHDAVREEIAGIYLKALSQTLAEAEAQVLKKLGQGKVQNSAVIPLLFDLAAIKESFDNNMAGAANDALAVSGQQMLTELGADKKFEAPEEFYHQFVQQRQNKLKDVPEEIYSQVKKELEAGMAKGDSTAMLAGRIKQVFGDISNGRAQVIARTETASAYGTGRLKAMTGAGFTHKSWLSADDSKVRPSHAEAEAEGAIPVDQDFGNGLTYPGDPDAPPEEVINCRCVLQAADAPEGDE